MKSLLKGKTMMWQEALRLIDEGQFLAVMCPDGIERTVWGYNAQGDLYVFGWEGDVWMDCSDGTLKAEFATQNPIKASLMLEGM